MTGAHIAKGEDRYYMPELPEQMLQFRMPVDSIDIKEQCLIELETNDGIVLMWAEKLVYAEETKETTEDTGPNEPGS